MSIVTTKSRSYQGRVVSHREVVELEDVFEAKPVVFNELSSSELGPLFAAFGHVISHADIELTWLVRTPLLYSQFSKCERLLLARSPALGKDVRAIAFTRFVEVPDEPSEEEAKILKRLLRPPSPLEGLLEFASMHHHWSVERHWDNVDIAM